MGTHAGLTKVTKNVKGKKGMVRRSYWVRGKEAAKSGAKKIGGFLNKHKGKIAAGAALAGAAYMGVKHGSKISGAYHGAKAGIKHTNALAGVLGTTATRKEKAFGAVLGAATGAHDGAWKDSERMNRIRGAATAARKGASSAVRAAAGTIPDAVRAVAAHRANRKAGMTSTLRGAFNGIRAARHGRG